MESTDSGNTDPHSEINSSNTTGGASKRIGIFLNSYFLNSYYYVKKKKKYCLFVNTLN